MSPITTHILDVSAGCPAQGVTARLEFSESPGNWTSIGEGTTNADGRVTNLLADTHRLEPGTYQITFQTGDYYKSLDQRTFFPFVSIVFEIQNTGEHYHVPLLLSPFGYSTYRGS